MNESEPSPEVKIYGWITPAVLAEIDRMLVPRWKRIYRRVAIVGGIILATVILVCGGLLAAGELISERSSAVIAICCIVPGYFLLIWTLRKGARVDFLKDAYQEAANPFEITLLETGVQIVSKRGRGSFVYWDDLLSFREGSTVILLRASGNVAIPIPVDVLYDSKREEVRNFIMKKLQNRPFLPNVPGGKDVGS